MRNAWNIGQQALRAVRRAICVAPEPGGRKVIFDALEVRRLFAVDFDPYEISGPSSAAAGSAINVFTDVDNKGNGPSGTFTLKYYFSTNSTINSSDTLLKTTTHGSIAGGTYQQWNEQVILPSSLPAGEGYIGVIVDPNNAIAETNESNNNQASDNKIKINGSSNSLATQANIQALAKVIMSEASVGNWDERVAVGSTVINRMKKGGYTAVTSVWSAYAYGQNPTSSILALAEQLLNGSVADNTGGCTHFYSPISMPKEGQTTIGFDVGGGLEQVPGLPYRNYRPSWALTLTYVNVSGVRPAYFKFYK